MAGKPTVLVIADRAEVRRPVASDLARAGFRVVEARSSAEALRCLQRDRPVLAVIHARGPADDGIELLRRVRARAAIPVLALGESADVATAVAAMKGGACEFLGLPDDRGRLAERARGLTGALAPEVGELERRLVGTSAAMRRARDRICALAPLHLPVLMVGEPGTGRDAAARALHALGERPSSPLVVFRAGHERPPRLPARGGSLYLDEVARMAPPEQGYWLDLLRAPARERRPLRVLASTRDDLRARAAEGDFHPELARRLRRFTVALPPLRERRRDVPELATALAERIGAQLGRERLRFERSALELLERQPWPGNVRELAEVVERLVAFSGRGAISRETAREVLGEAPNNVASLRRRRRARQREELVALLEDCGGNLAEVARRLRLSRGAVIYRAQRHGLLPPRR